MSRNPDYQFFPTDAGEIVLGLVAAYEAFTEEVIQPASPEMLFIRWVASVIIQERVLNNWTGNQNIPSRAEGENLDALAELTYSKARPKATAATCTMRFSQLTSVLIPAGTRISNADNTLVWATSEDNYIPIGETAIDVENVMCQTTGTVGNGYMPGQISKLVDLYDFFSSCENITESDGGSDVPDDDEYYELMRASMDAYSCAGARGSYIYFAKQVSTEIADVIANSPTPGVVKLYVLMQDGTLATEEMKSRVLAACSADEVRPLTDYVIVEDADIVPYDVEFTYYLQTGSSKSAADIAADVQKAVEQYTSWQDSKLGRDINPSRLVSLLMGTGIKRVEVISPLFTKLEDGKEFTETLSEPVDGETWRFTAKPPQVAKLGSVTITNGGYEDE